MIKQDNLHGRQILIKNFQKQKASQYGNLVSAFSGDKCLRCGQSKFYTLPTKVRQCMTCVELKAVFETDFLLRVPSTNFEKVTGSILTWGGRLTKEQQKISQQLVKYLKNKQDSLVHAVTGAGKTEMLFESIAFVLKEGMRVAICCPRVDVVDELFERLSIAFSKTQIGKYHGNAHPPSFNYQLIICTTHQLMKFFAAFDLIVIDEVDAFPFESSAILHYAMTQALKPLGQKILLTATPSQALLTQVKKGKLNYLLLNKRYHGYRLPVPKCHLLWQRNAIGRFVLDFRLKKILSQFIVDKKPILIFVDKIAKLPELKTKLKRFYPDLIIDTVSSVDSERHQKILRFREGKIELLLTTTILERGVTFENVQVIILDADDAIFKTSSLVQIAGRAGRKIDFPDGEVHFFYHHYTGAIKKCVSQIKRMNKWK
ncbi:helicase-related protein [Holzapfeliella floricola]|uniref:ComF operon protein 1 n=1 Tax=Holzapfeliella floricola DSM 23037 = JCM 16512 TaxID=1423744 RepID=A0A0R2DJ90_9LACO|nr:helicase-related protein [Holzapfeliella floricola]KRN04178.1 ComF operon protein 1 [Holzapfeliella floricola DSM 23037 = JCM 16512]